MNAERTNQSDLQIHGARERYRHHVLARIAEAEVGVAPFHHAFIEDIFPTELYGAIRDHMLRFKHSDQVQDRHQDNPNFMNRRYNLSSSTDEPVEHLRTVFSDPEIKQVLINKFYLHPHNSLTTSLTIHEEFEYVFTAAHRFQNIHIDIPPKFMSFVFYIPEHAVGPIEQERNATILYDKFLNPNYKARYTANSVCIFVPHFSSYHGFSSTTARDVLVMFYIDAAEMNRWLSIRQSEKDEPPFTGLLDSIHDKLRNHPLRQFEGSEQKLLEERRACLVNAPQGRILR